MEFYEEYLRPDRRSSKSKAKAKASQPHWLKERERQFGDFKCLHCRRPVTADPLMSGVNHRNHCPACLWSKHVDLHESGDRLAACKGPMRPVGLTFKRRHKKYASHQPGELMLVHHCTGCGALSINRLAADDYAPAILAVFDGSLVEGAGWREQAEVEGIEVLGDEVRAVVRTAVGC
jgi:hypothetical protein